MEHRGLARLNIASSQADHIDIVCPEAVAILQQREAVARDSPEIASFPPIISSQHSFNAAIEYLELSLAYENILRSSTCLYPSLDLMNHYQNTLKEMLSYVETLQDHHLDYFKREKDQQEFSEIYYYLNQRLALSYLTIMIFDMARAPSYLQNFIEAKKRVPPSSSFYKEMQKIITDMLEAKPDLVSVLYPQQSASKVRIEKPKLSKKLRQRQKVARQVKIASLNQEKIPSEALKGNFDIYFYMRSDEIILERNIIYLKGDLLANKEGLERLAKKYMVLETVSRHQAAEFLRSGSSPNQPSSLEIIDFYCLLQKRVVSPERTPEIILEHSIYLFLQAGCLEEALLRTDVLKALLLKKGGLEKRFIHFRASILALNGQFDEWQRLINEKQERQKKYKHTFHAKKVASIKHLLASDSAPSQPEPRETLVSQPLGDPRSERTATQASGLIPDSGFVTHSTTPINYKSQIVFPPAKIKTRKASSSTDQPIAESHSKETSQACCFLSSKAFKTYSKIRSDNWHLSRQELHHLFSRLGCEVDMGRGKGSHSRIFLQHSFTVTREGKLIAVLPEFIPIADLDKSHTMTMPNWDSKWDGHVPFYLRKQVMAALECLGATDERVVKKSQVSINSK